MRPPRDLSRDLPPIVGIQASSGQERRQVHNRANRYNASQGGWLGFGRWPRTRTVSWLKVYARQAVAIILPPSNHPHRVPVQTGLFVHGGVTGKYPVPLWCCSQSVTRSRAARMRKSPQRISQVLLPLLCRAICGIGIMRDQLLSASNHDYAWAGNWM